MRNGGSKTIQQEEVHFEAAGRLTIQCSTLEPESAVMNLILVSET